MKTSNVVGLLEIRGMNLRINGQMLMADPFCHSASIFSWLPSGWLLSRRAKLEWVQSSHRLTLPMRFNTPALGREVICCGIGPTENTMHVVAHEPVAKFPPITFRKKRLTVDIHATIDLETAKDAADAKQMIEQAITRLSEEFQTKVTYSVCDI